MTAVPQDQWREMRVAGFMSRLGQLQALRGPDGWRYGLLADDSHLNAVGVVHGGVITSLIDHTVALCAWEAAGRRPVVTVQCDTRFLAPARSGDFIEARAMLHHQGRSLIHLNAEICVAGRLIASGAAIMKRVDPEPEARND